VYIAGVVGKQNKGLKMFNWRPRVVTQSRQREIDTARVEVRERIKLTGVEQTVRGLVANLRQFSGGEKARQSGAHRAVKRQLGTVNDIRIRNFMMGRFNRDMRVI